MLIGVVSDTHNNIKNIERIIHLFNELDLSLVVHTGDIASANSLDKFSDLKCKLIGVYGNNDRHEQGIEEIVAKYNFQFEEPPLTLVINGRNVAIFHEPDLIEDFLSKNEETEVILHGHTHRYRNEKKKDILFFNPGESAGMQTGKNAIGVLDLKNLNARRIFF